MEIKETICVSVDTDLYEAAKASLEGLKITPEEYVSLCFTEMLRQRIQLLEMYRDSEMLEHMLSGIADTVLDKLAKENGHASSDH